MTLDNFKSYIKFKWAKIYKRFLAKYILSDVTYFEPPHLTQLKIILNLLNFNFGLVGASILGEFKFTKTTYFMITYIHIVLVILIYSVICVLDDTSLLLQTITLIGTFIPSAMVLYDMFLKNGKFVSLLEFSLRVFKVNNNVKRGAILDAQIRNTKVYLLKLVFILVFAMSVYAAGAIYVITLKQLPAPYYIPFVDHTTTIGYVITLIVQIATVALAAILHFPHLVLMSLIILHYDNLVALIQDDFDQLSNLVSSSRSEKAVRMGLFIKIVVQITETRRYTEYVYDLYMKTIFWQITTAYLSATISIFEIIAFKWYTGIVAIIYFLAEIYIMSYLGQFVINTNDKLAHVVYSVDWNNYPIKEQKNILSLLHMTQFNCVELWIGIFAPLCIQTGFEITQNIYSYTMLLFELIDH